MKPVCGLLGVGLAVVASVSSGGDSLGASSSRPAATGKALAEQRARMLSDVNGHYDARLVHASLIAREKLLGQQGPARSGASRASSASGSAVSAPVAFNWTAIGPGNVGGRINALVIDSGNGQRLVAGAAGGGLWQSLDAGQSWAAVGGFPGTLAVGALAQSGANTWLAGTGDQFNVPQAGIGLVLSTDGGNTWTPVNSTAPSLSNPDWYYVNAIAVSTGGIVLAATGSNGLFPADLHYTTEAGAGAGGLWRSTNGGQTWTRVWPAAGQENPSYDVIFDPNNANGAVADTDRGTVVYSTDAGLSWNAAAGLPAQSGLGFRVALAFDPSAAGSVYALVDNAPAGGPSGEVFHSTDGGKTWSLLADTAAFVNQDSATASGALCDNSAGSATLACQGGYDNVIAVVPHGSGKPTLVTGGVDIFASLDGGTTWGEVGSWIPTDSNYIHADDHAIAYDAANQTLYVGNDGGLFELPAAATTWTAINSGLAITQFYRIDGHRGVTASQNAPGGTPITPILAGAQDNGMQLYLGYTPGGAPQPNNWVSFMGGDGVAARVDPVDGDFLYGEYPQLQISYSGTGGPSGQGFGTQPPDNSASPSTADFVAPLALVPNGNQAANQMLAGGASLWFGNGIQSGNPSWTSLNGSTLPVGTNGNYISAIEIDPNTINNIWLGYNDGEIWVTSNATLAVPTWSRIASAALPRQQVTDIWVLPGQSNTIYVTYAGFAAVGNNVFMSNDGGITWLGIGSALPPGPVYTLVSDPNYPQVLYAGTYTGVYTSVDNGRTWSTSNAGPANIAVNQLTWFDSGSTPVLLAATDGRGAWLGSPAYNATPALTGISPTQVLAGSSASTLTLSGNGFAANAAVDFDGNAVAGTSVLSSTQIQLTLPASDLATAGMHTLTVINPVPGGGSSAGAILTVTNPRPTASSLSPASMAAGSGGFVLTVSGTGFASNSVVQWNGSPLTTTMISPTSLRATVPAGDVATVGSASITVSSPTPGGGTSGALTFTTPAPPSGGSGGGGGRTDLLLTIVLLTLAAARVTAVLPKWTAGE